MSARAVACPRTRWLLAVLCTAGCAAPVVYPRTGDVLRAGDVRLKLATVLLPVAPTSAELDAPAQADVESGTYRDYWTARRARTASVGADMVLGPAVSLEPHFAFSPFGWCELGISLSFVRAGGELRCAVLDEDVGHPLSIAVSGAALDQWLLTDEGYELRTGIDVSFRNDGVTPLLGVYVAQIPLRWEILSGLPTAEREEWANDPGEIYVTRDELRLAVPIGAAIEITPRSRPDDRARIVLAVVPELTLHADAREPPVYEHDSTVIVTRFVQQWALFVTIGVELELGLSRPPRSTAYLTSARRTTCRGCGAPR